MADRLAGGALEAILRGLRADGESYDTIAKRLYADHGVDVTGQTVQNWWTAIVKADHNICPECPGAVIGPCEHRPNEPAVAS